MTPEVLTPEELVAVACPKIRDLGWAYFFAPQTVARGEELGLDVLSFYFLGRGGVLGDVEPAVVTSAFGYFKPSLIEGVWTAAAKIVAPRDAGRAYVECAAVYGRAVLSDVEGLDAFVAAADAVNAAADPVGLALYAAAKAEPLADDAPARAMQLLSLLREFRGSAHLIAVRAVGLDALTAHAITRPGDLGMFGWDESEMPEITAADRAARDEAEELTDRMTLAAYSVLDPAGRQALASGLDAIEAAITGSQ
jgi:hypothetical protein